MKAGETKELDVKCYDSIGNPLDCKVTLSINYPGVSVYENTFVVKAPGRSLFQVKATDGNNTVSGYGVLSISPGEAKRIQVRDQVVLRAGEIVDL